VIALHGPGEIKKVAATVGIVHLLTIRENQAFSRRQTPHKRDIVFFPTAVRAGLTRCQCFGIGKTKSPEKA